MEKSEEFYRLVTMHLNGKISGRKVAKQLGISHTCFQNWLRDVYRIKLGGYRVVYAIINKKIIVISTILAGARGDVYKKMGGLK